MKRILFAFAAVTLLAASCSTKTEKISGINYEYMDTTVSPGNDFAQYATGHWGDFNPQPMEYPVWGAFHKLADDNGFTPEQRFFLAYANVWAGTATDEILRYLTMMDVHSVDRLRINGALSQCNYWYDAFDIKESDEYYVAPEDRIDVW